MDTRRMASMVAAALVLALSAVGCDDDGPADPPGPDAGEHDTAAVDTRATDTGEVEPDASHDTAADDDTDGGDDIPTDLADTTAPLPTVAEAFADCTAPGEAGGLASGMALGRVDIDTARFPDATCADGSPGLFFVQRGSDSTRWVLQLQGGGACSDPDDCVARWCSHETNFGANKMSNRFAPERGMRARGILADHPDNQFRDWNKVFVYYCTSDLWTGNRGLSPASAAHPIEGGAPVEFLISHQGTAVLDAVVGMLRDGELGYVDPDTQQPATMPDLDTATEVVLAGSSAGGNGVTYQADRLGAVLRATNPGLTHYRGIVDSAFGLSLTDVDMSSSVLCTELGLCTALDYYAASYQDSRVDYWQAHLDDTCESWHESNDPATLGLCADNTHVVEHHLQTPFVLRMGLTDSLIGEGFAARGFTRLDDPSVGVDLMVFAELLSAKIAALAELPTTAEEATTIGVAPGLFAPPCPKHETLSDDASVYDTVIGVDGSPVRFMDVIAGFAAGQSPAAVFVPGSGQAFSCE